MAWATFFTFAGLTNIYVAYRYEEATWVNFKMFGLLGMTLGFLVLQTLWLSKYMSDSPETDEKES
jgi:intracellular septation protein